MKIGVLSVSDTRASVHEDLLPYIQACEGQICGLLDSLGIAWEAGEVIHSAGGARAQGRAMLAKGVDGILFNIAMFSFPNLTAIAARVFGGPVMAYDIANPDLPGLVGLKANAGMLRQCGIRCEALWGAIDEAEVRRGIEAFSRAAHAVSALKGSVLGIIGGRSIGIGTASLNPDLLMSLFGVDVEHIDQLELVRRAALIPDAETEAAVAWLSDHMRAIRYDDDKLTLQTLRLQIKYFLATRQIIEENGLDFGGVKCHCEMSAHYSTQCLPVMLLNDLYDWTGSKESFSYSCESDGDGALTMQVLKLMTGMPSFLVDMRYYDRTDDLLVLCNCGAMPSWYAARSEDSTENLAATTLEPIIPKYKGTGCHVRFIAAPGEITFARFTRTGSRYKCTAFLGEAVSQPEKRLEKTTPQWPHIFVKTAAPMEVVRLWECNHLHGTPANRRRELSLLCGMLDIDFVWIE